VRYVIYIYIYICDVSRLRVNHQRVSTAVEIIIRVALQEKYEKTDCQFSYVETLSVLINVSDYHSFM
jgi:hypothetical protein